MRTRGAFEKCAAEHPNRSSTDRAAEPPRKEPRRGDRSFSERPRREPKQYESAPPRRTPSPMRTRKASEKCATDNRAAEPLRKAPCRDDRFSSEKPRRGDRFSTQEPRRDERSSSERPSKVTLKPRCDVSSPDRAEKDRYNDNSSPVTLRPRYDVSSSPDRANEGSGYRRSGAAPPAGVDDGSTARGSGGQRPGAAPPAGNHVKSKRGGKVNRGAIEVVSKELYQAGDLPRRVIAFRMTYINGALIPVCRSYNLKKCVGRCIRGHVCARCAGAHPILDCDDEEIEREGCPMPEASEQGFMFQ